MNILLDTHLAIWAINDDAMLTEKARVILLDADNDLFYSAATVIEIDWKIRSKKNNLDFRLTSISPPRCFYYTYLKRPKSRPKRL